MRPRVAVEKPDEPHPRCPWPELPDQRIRCPTADDLGGFLGATDFLIAIDDEPCRIQGIGVRDAIGVRFTEIPDPQHTSRKRRTWRICAVPGSGFMAVPLC